MRFLFFIWLIPAVLLSVWFGLSANNIHFGTRIFSRELHDVVMQVYAQTLGVEVHELPGLLWRAVIFDGAIIGAIIAFRKRVAIKSWYRQVFTANTRATPVIGQDSPAK